MQSTEKKTITSLTIRGIERDLERTPSGRGGVISHSPATKGIGPSGTPGENLLADWRELEAALAAERDRADRAEARILSAPHSSYCWVYSNVPVPLLKTGAGMDRCNCWHAEATA